MVTITSSRSTPSQISIQTNTLSSLRFDWLMALLGVWLIGGLYLDSWAHNHNPDLETFIVAVDGMGVAAGPQAVKISRIAVRKIL